MEKNKESIELVLGNIFFIGEGTEEANAIVHENMLVLACKNVKEAIKYGEFLCNVYGAYVVPKVYKYPILFEVQDTPTLKISIIKINDFIKEYCTKVRANESCSYTELMMDNHRCIEWNNKNFYLPENNSFWSEGEQEIADFLEFACIIK